MIEQKETLGSTELADVVIKGMQEKKALNIVDLDLKSIKNAVCDHFIICHGTSNTHISAIADAVEEFVKKETGQNAWHKEGYQNAEWILLDYFDVVVHIFQEEARNYYKLEKLWADAESAAVSSR